MSEDKVVVVNSFVGAGSFYRGNIESNDLLRIDGNFHGTAKSKDAILVGEYGKVKGDLQAPRIIIAGLFQGFVKQCNLVILQSTAIFIGNLNVHSIVIEPGAIITGSLVAKQKRLGSYSDSELESSDDSETQQVRRVGSFTTKILEKMFRT